MAAGVGSRFGGTKQLAEVGPSGEALLDYTIADARRAGFERIVLIVRSEIRDPVLAHLRRFHADADRFALVCQDADPSAPPRAKPWGTGHAVLSVADQVAGPFVVVNADDYYGPQAFKTVSEALAGGVSRELHLVAFSLARTLSPRGTVSRGVCEVHADGTLRSITEHLAIERAADGTIRAGEGAPELPADTPVSMNLWGLQPFVFDELREGFGRFVADHRDDPKAEYLLPEVIGQLTDRGVASVRVHRTSAEWLGVTYPGDLDDARQRMAELVKAGAYPSPLFDG
jgi:NDP-sugar pyrophosphorylase family protein